MVLASSKLLLRNISTARWASSRFSDRVIVFESCPPSPLPFLAGFSFSRNLDSFRVTLFELFSFFSFSDGTSSRASSNS